MARANTTTAVQQAASLSPDELTAILQKSGFADQGSNTPRISLKNGTLTTSDGGMYVYNPRKPAEPMMTVRLLKPLDEYNAIWIDNDRSQPNKLNHEGMTPVEFLGRTDIEGTFSKKWFRNDETRPVWDSDAQYDRLKQGGFKPSWKGDLLVAIMPDDGAFKGNETPHLLTLSTTSVIEFKGAGNKPEGSISDKNFIQKLIAFAIEQAKPATKEEAEKAVLDALTSYSLGGVVAEIRTGTGEDKEHNRNWTVLIFDPVHIEPLSSNPAIEAGNDADQHDEDPAL